MPLPYIVSLSFSFFFNNWRRSDSCSLAGCFFLFEEPLAQDGVCFDQFDKLAAFAGEVIEACIDALLHSALGIGGEGADHSDAAAVGGEREAVAIDCFQTGEGV